ncbi:MAG: antibiotic biosynthesis monooxygenase [Pseudomonadales bacterium]|nr:antibiotic biosynthesis monooxygenase [Pseudomonadales bacterium]
MSIRVTLNCQVKPGQFSSLLPFLEENLPTVRAFRGNMRVSVLFDKSHNEMLLDEEWLTQDDHKAYLDFIGNNGTLQQLAAFLSQPPEIKYFETVEI